MIDTFQSTLKCQNSGFLRHADQSDREKVVRVAFILFDHFSLTAFSTVMDALATGNMIDGGTMYQTSTYSFEGGLIESDIGVAVSSEKLSPERLNHDAVIVVGGQRVKLSANPHLRQILKRSADKKAIVAGIWNGAFYLADAGLLDGQRCACHADSCALMNEYFPQVEISGSDYIYDQRRATCSVASTALDMILAIMQDLCASDETVAVDEIWRIHKPRQRQAAGVKPYVSSRPESIPALTIALMLMEKHIEEPMDIDEIANHVGVSRRQLERRFSRYLNAAPNRYYLELRLTHARQLIVQSKRSMTDIALATGFVSYPHFYKRFKDLFGLPPVVFRDTYVSDDWACA